MITNTTLDDQSVSKKLANVKPEMIDFFYFSEDQIYTFYAVPDSTAKLGVRISVKKAPPTAAQ